MTPNPCDIKILDRLTVVNLSVAIWTARKKLTAADFGGAELPPEELASWGSKKVCDPEVLRIFGTLKSRAVSQLDRIGIRFLNGWAIPENMAQNIHDKLINLKDEFLTAKETFLSSYDQAVRDWVDKHPGWEQLIAASTVSADYVRNRLAFNWQFYKIASPNQRDEASDNLVREVEGLGDTLFGEISKEAQAVWNKVYAGKTEVSHKALSPLRSMHSKLNGLSFLEPRVAPVADLIEAAMLSVPKRGKISGPHLILLQGLVSMLRDPNLLLDHGQKVIEGADPRTVISHLSVGHPGSIAYEPDESESESEDSLESQSFPQQKYVDSLGLW